MILKCPVNILVSILIKKIYMYTSSLALGVSPETPWWPLSPGDREQRRSGGGLVTAPSPQGVVSLGGRASPFLRQSVCSVQSEAAVGFIAPGFGFSAACGRDSSPTWARGTLRRAPRGVSGGVPGLHPPHVPLAPTCLVEITKNVPRHRHMCPGSTGPPWVSTTAFVKPVLFTFTFKWKALPQRGHLS